ncbi:endonuclease domain-containing protein [uncultured Tessaracoccus sp.]|uniref:endonuclease domain-containing protein n=1 Tax=uncultured Tessaracoccus sp. TaxID=905023 RepID=UPI0025FC1082|nr:hypothetical protein [uncultured Tessaracoccus sp.]
MNLHIHAREELFALDWRAHDITRALADGRLRRIAKSFFAGPGAPEEAVAVVARGGRLGCLTGCRIHGVWTPDTPQPHVIIGRNQVRRPGRIEHKSRTALPRSAVYLLEDCLAQVIRHHDPETALMVLESAANLALVPPSVAWALIDGATVHARRTLQFFEPASQSGSETRVRLWLQQRNVPVQPQAHIPGLGFVDLLVGRSQILECDSDAHHRSGAQQEEDRRRDLLARELGYATERLSYAQIHHHWEPTSEVLARLLATRRHLRAPRPL